MSGEMLAPHCLTLSLLLACALAGNSFGQQAIQAQPSADTAFDYALDVVLDGQKTQIVDKRVGPIRAILTCRDEPTRQLVHRAVGEINDLFGYGKIALSEADNAQIDDDAITIFVGSKSDGRQLVEDFGVSSPRAFRGAIYYYWWDQSCRNRIGRCLVALDETSSLEVKAENLSYLLLACMGFRSPWSAKKHEQATGIAGSVHSARLEDLHRATVRFFDKHVPPGSTAHEMRRIYKREWPDFSAAYWNPSSQSAVR